MSPFYLFKEQCLFEAFSKLLLCCNLVEFSVFSSRYSFRDVFHPRQIQVTEYSISTRQPMSIDWRSRFVRSIFHLTVHNLYSISAPGLPRDTILGPCLFLLYQWRTPARDSKGLANYRIIRNKATMKRPLLKGQYFNASGRIDFYSGCNRLLQLFGQLHSFEMPIKAIPAWLVIARYSSER